MSKMKKIWALALTAFMTVGLAACGGEPETSESSGGDTLVEIPKYLAEKADSAGRLTLNKESDCPADFVLEAEGDEPLRVLQLTDTQMIDETQVRKGNGAVSSKYADHDYCVYDIVRQTVEATDPDLILITGDYVVGDYDDNGTLFREQTDFFDSLGIYWAPIFGNHDNDCDSELAVWLDSEWPDWYPRKQCQYFEQAEYCLFRTRAQVSGYSNYSIAIEQGGEVIRSIYMMDTKGSMHTTMELTKAQMNWYEESVTELNAYAGKIVPSFVGIHVPMDVFTVAMKEKYGEAGFNATPTQFTIPEDNADGDFGFTKGSGSGGFDADLKQFNIFKENGTDAIMAGHLHKNNLCVLYQGVRLVMGTKSSRYDKYNEDQLGGTYFTLTGSTYTVAPYYYTEVTTEIE